VFSPLVNLGPNASLHILWLLRNIPAQAEIAL
jgi:hypothetical protein